MLGVAAAIAFGMLSATAAGAVPVSFAVSGSLFKVSADYVAQSGVTQYAGLGHQGAHAHEAIIATAQDVSMTDMCQSMLVPTPLGDLTMRVTAGQDRPVTADSMVIDAQQLSADADFTGLKVGDTSGDGSAGQTVDQLAMRQFRMTAWTTSAGTFHMPGMRISVELGRQSASKPAACSVACVAGSARRAACGRCVAGRRSCDRDDRAAVRRLAAGDHDPGGRGERGARHLPPAPADRLVGSGHGPYSRYGYLDEKVLAYALAYLSFRRGEHTPVWRAIWEPGPRAAFDKSMAYFYNHRA